MIGNKKIRQLEERIACLELGQSGIRELNSEFMDMHRSEKEINQNHLELFEEISKHLEWMNGAIAMLSFAAAGLLVGLLESRLKIVELKKMMNEG